MGIFASLFWEAHESENPWHIPEPPLRQVRCLPGEMVVWEMKRQFGMFLDWNNKLVKLRVWHFWAIHFWHLTLEYLSVINYVCSPLFRIFLTSLQSVLVCVVGLVRNWGLKWKGSGGITNLFRKFLSKRATVPQVLLPRASLSYWDNLFCILEKLEPSYTLMLNSMESKTSYPVAYSMESLEMHCAF